MTLSKYNEVMDKVKVSDEMRQRILQNIENEGKVTEFDQRKKAGNAGDKVVRFIKVYGSRVAIFALIIAGTYGVIKTVGLNSSKQESATYSADFATETAVSEEAAEDSAMYEYETETAEATEEAEASPSYDKLMDGKKAEDSSMGTNTAVPEVTDAARAEDAEATKTGAALEADIAEAPETADEMVEGAAMESAEDAAEREEFASLSELSKAAGFDIRESDSLKDASKDIMYFLYPEGAEVLHITENDVISLYASETGTFTGNSYIDLGAFEEIREVDSETAKAAAENVTLYGDGKLFRAAAWNTDGVFYTLTSEEGMTEDEMIKLLDVFRKIKNHAE